MATIDEVRIPAEMVVSIDAGDLRRVGDHAEVDLSVSDVVLDASVGGRAVDPFAPPPDCEHGQVMQQLDYATDEAGCRSVRLRLVCGLCGCRMRFLIDSARPSSECGADGLVCDIEPV